MASWARLAARPERGKEAVQQREGIDQGDQGRDADDDARHHDGDIGQAIEGDPQRAPHLLQGQRRHGAHDCGERRRGAGDDQAVLQRLDDEGVVRGLAVPDEGEMLEVAGVVAAVEAEEDDQRDRRIEEEIDEDGIAAQHRPRLTSARRRAGPARASA